MHAHALVRAYLHHIKKYTNTDDGHYSDVLMARGSLKSPAARLFTQPFIEAQIKENNKAPRNWSLWGEFIRTKGQ